MASVAVALVTPGTCMCRCHGHQPAGLATLSRREREIAELVGAGKTNREIATACYRSDKTVKRHLSNIFTSSVSQPRPLPARLRASLRPITEKKVNRRGSGRGGWARPADHGSSAVLVAERKSHAALGGVAMPSSAVTASTTSAMITSARTNRRNSHTDSTS